MKQMHPLLLLLVIPSPPMIEHCLFFQGTYPRTEPEFFFLFSFFFNLGSSPKQLPAQQKSLLLYPSISHPHTFSEYLPNQLKTVSCRFPSSRRAPNRFRNVSLNLILPYPANSISRIWVLYLSFSLARHSSLWYLVSRNLFVLSTSKMLFRTACRE